MVDFGVSQGSVLRPLLFLLYTADLVMAIQSYDLQPHLYADESRYMGSVSLAPLAVWRIVCLSVFRCSVVGNTCCLCYRLWKKLYPKRTASLTYVTYLQSYHNYPTSVPS